MKEESPWVHTLNLGHWFSQRRDNLKEVRKRCGHVSCHFKDPWRMSQTQELWEGASVFPFPCIQNRMDSDPLEKFWEHSHPACYKHTSGLRLVLGWSKHFLRPDFKNTHPLRMFPHKNDKPAKIIMPSMRIPPLSYCSGESKRFPNNMDYCCCTLLSHRCWR